MSELRDLRAGIFLAPFHPVDEDPTLALRRDIELVESVEVILRLFKGETVTEETEWFTLRNARCQLLPYSKPYPEMAVAGSVTLSGGRLAGKHGFGMLCVAATNTAGYDALAINWAVANKVAAEHGRHMDPACLGLVGPMHIAESREEARRESLAWAKDNAGEFMGAAVQAVQKTIAKYAGDVPGG